jgi:hypothetical protein
VCRRIVVPNGGEFGGGGKEGDGKTGGGEGGGGDGGLAKRQKQVNAALCEQNVDDVALLLNCMTCTEPVSMR